MDSFEAYMRKREQAVNELKNATILDEKTCVVGNQVVKVSEKDLLLKQLTERYEYLNIPVELILTSRFWRDLKADSTQRIQNLRIK